MGSIRMTLHENLSLAPKHWLVRHQGILINPRHPARQKMHLLTSSQQGQLHLLALILPSWIYCQDKLQSNMTAVPSILTISDLPTASFLTMVMKHCGRAPKWNIQGISLFLNHRSTGTQKRSCRTILKNPRRLTNRMLYPTRRHLKTGSSILKRCLQTSADPHLLQNS